MVKTFSSYIKESYNTLYNLPIPRDTKFWETVKTKSTYTFEKYPTVIDMTVADVFEEQKITNPKDLNYGRFIEEFFKNYGWEKTAEMSMYERTQIAICDDGEIETEYDDIDYYDEMYDYGHNIIYFNVVNVESGEIKSLSIGDIHSNINKVKFEANVESVMRSLAPVEFIFGISIDVDENQMRDLSDCVREAEKNAEDWEATKRSLNQQFI